MDQFDQPHICTSTFTRGCKFLQTFSTSSKKKSPLPLSSFSVSLCVFYVVSCFVSLVYDYINGKVSPFKNKSINISFHNCWKCKIDKREEKFKKRRGERSSAVASGPWQLNTDPKARSRCSETDFALSKGKFTDVRVWGVRQARAGRLEEGQCEQVKTGRAEWTPR